MRSLRRKEGGLTREEQLARMPFHFWLEKYELGRQLRWELGTWYVGRRWSMVNRALYLAAPSAALRSPHASPGSAVFRKGRNRNEGSRYHVTLLPINIHVRECHVLYLATYSIHLEECNAASSLPSELLRTIVAIKRTTLARSDGLAAAVWPSLIVICLCC